MACPRTISADAGARGSVGVVTTQTAEIALASDEGLVLERGGRLRELRVAYETYGDLSARRDNVIFICHALTGDAHAAGYHAAGDRATRGWWDEMIGPGKGIDTNHYHVVCANILGGCKGTTGPSSIDPETGAPYGATFPRITLGDIVKVHTLLLRHLGIERVAAVVGGSLGGMQALEWTIAYPEMLDRCVCIAAAAELAAQALAFDIVGRRAITSDPDWRGGDYYREGLSPSRGLAQARAIGHITYLSQGMMEQKFGRERADTEHGAVFQVERYLEHQGEKFVKRFDANSYLRITEAMDDYSLSDRYGGMDRALARVRAKLLVVALSADWLFPPEQSMELANALLRAGRRVSFCNLQAPHGHDAFLVDIEHLSEVVRAFLPWVGDGAPRVPSAIVSAAAPRDRTTRLRVREYASIVDMVRQGARVLDLGCGSGELLTELKRRRDIAGIGVDIDIGHVISVLDRGHDIFQGDIDAGLAMIPDGTYDYAILSETLQVVKRPQFVLRELLRVARRGIVTFPNFGKWRHRLDLVFRGRMPLGKSLPFAWYDTPNIHLFTLRDFVTLCREDGIRIHDMVCIPANGFDRLLIAAQCCNLGADRVLVTIAPAGAGEPTMPRGRCCRLPTEPRAERNAANGDGTNAGGGETAP